MPRLFIAIDLPETTKDSLAVLQNGLREAKWVARENLHLTVRFIGEVSEEEVCEIHSVLAAVRGTPFTFEFGEIGIFSSAKKLRSMWVGVKDGSSIGTLRRHIDRSLFGLGFKPEGRRYIPHVTVGRFRCGPTVLPEFMARTGFGTFPSVRVDQFVLFSSFLTQTGAIYTPEAYYPLNSW